MAAEILSPSYRHAPLVTYDIDGAELILRLPQHNGGYEPLLLGRNVDLSDMALYQEGGPPFNYYYLTLIENSWTYRFADSPIDAGSLLLSVAVMRAVKVDEKTYNLLEKEYFSQWVLEGMEQLYGSLNEEEKLELQLNDLPVAEEEMWQYPKTHSDLTFFSKCGVDWCCGWTGHPSMGKFDPFICVPINSNTALNFGVRFGGFNPEYFESDELVKATKETLLQEFLEHVYISYPSKD